MSTSKQRQPSIVATDEGKATLKANSGFAKLNEDAVREMRRLYANGDISLQLLGKRFGVSLSAVHRVISRTAWAHVN